MPKISDTTKGLSGSELERLALEGEGLGAYRQFWDRAAVVDSIHAISDQDDAESFEVSGHREMDELAPLLPPGGGAALEIGCGTGRVMQHLAPRCRALHGIDISAEMVEQGRRRLAHLRNVSFHVGNGYDLAPFGDESFDLVYSLFAFQHMPKTTAYNYFTESRRVLRPNGVLRFQVPNILRDDHFNAFHHFTQPYFVEHPYPMNYYTPSEVVLMLARAGFRVEDLSDGMAVVARKADDVTADVAIRERVARFEHPRLMAEREAQLAGTVARLAEANAEIERYRRRIAVRAANTLRHPLRRSR